MSWLKRRRGGRPAPTDESTDHPRSPEGEPSAEPLQEGATLAVEPVAVDAKTLSRAYRANQVAAEGRYRGRVLELRGLVDHVDRDTRGRIRIHLLVSDYHTMHALCPEEARAEVAELLPGDQVKVLARVAGVDTGYVVVEVMEGGEEAGPGR